ncbi:hypothetical protein EVAR_17102_1 [Eumeta japonica]|uniref:Uncharacterized protein n=1 Tax=Eumeta variegata TaxID=151549 RepID=A0A4C1UN32_EUMVA|nr:hypothetical protein EVAR_17102_1 [Eumeta japonica]
MPSEANRYRWPVGPRGPLMKYMTFKWLSEAVSNISRPRTDTRPTGSGARDGDGESLKIRRTTKIGHVDGAEAKALSLNRAGKLLHVRMCLVTLTVRRRSRLLKNVVPQLTARKLSRPPRPAARARHMSARSV